MMARPYTEYLSTLHTHSSWFLLLHQDAFTIPQPLTHTKNPSHNLLIFTVYQGYCHAQHSWLVKLQLN